MTVYVSLNILNNGRGVLKSFYFITALSIQLYSHQTYLKNIVICFGRMYIDSVTHNTNITTKQDVTNGNIASDANTYTY